MSIPELAEGLSPSSSAVLTQLFASGSSEQISVADCLNTIASNGDELVTDRYLTLSAEEIVKAALCFLGWHYTSHGLQHFMRKYTERLAGAPEHRTCHGVDKTEELALYLTNGMAIYSGWTDYDDPDSLVCGDYMRLEDYRGFEQAHVEWTEFTNPETCRQKLCDFLVAAAVVG